MSHLNHEQRVERFYSYGSNTRHSEAEGFLSFGYWTHTTRSYLEAAEQLLNFVLTESGLSNIHSILNVSCGYGTETFKLFERLNPDRIVAIDVTKAHIDIARKRARDRHLEHRIQFEQADACRLRYPTQSFSLVIGIEGPAHFNPRRDFFYQAFRVLEEHGTLLLTDITVNAKAIRGRIGKRLAQFCAKQWHMPTVNWIDVATYANQLREVGFSVEKIQAIGRHVYPGFSAWNTKWSSMRRAMRTRGIRIGLGLTLISWLLGYTFRKGWLEYVFVKATK